MNDKNEIRAITHRVKELRQELEAVEARLRELAGDGAGLEPIEPVDSPTVLTTNHAQRQARRAIIVPALAATFAVLTLALGFGVGIALRPTPAAVSVPSTPPPPASAMTAPPLPTMPTSASVTEAIADAVPGIEPKPASSGTADPISPNAGAPVAAIPASAPAPMAPPVALPARRNNVDRGF
jgi:hypothetical protein